MTAASQASPARPARRSLSIRAKIALGTLLVALVLAAGAALLVRAQTAQVIRDAETTLATQDLDDLQAQIEHHEAAAVEALQTPTPVPSPRPHSDGDRDPAAQAAQQAAQQQAAEQQAAADQAAEEAEKPLRNPKPDSLVYVVAPDGTVALDTLPASLHDDVGASAGAATASPDQDDDDGDGQYALVSREVTTASGTWRIWAACSSAGGDLTLQRLDQGIWTGAALLVGILSLVAWALAGLALRPVGAMRRTAERLAAEPAASLAADGAGLLPVGGAKDELSDLAVTLNGLLERTRSAARREREMVSAAAHELRTPIAVLTTRLELAHRSFGDAPALEREIVDAERSLRRLSSLATNLLELSRLDASAASADSVDGVERAKPAASAAELESELMEAVDRARLLAGPDGPEVELELEELPAGASVALSKASVARILDNLVSNALDATPAGGSIRLLLRPVTDDAGASAVELAVEDDGRGVPEDFLPHAFERFARPEAGREAKTRGASGSGSGAELGGSGLGLALVAALAESADGAATLENRAGGGARAAVVLPIR